MTTAKRAAFAARPWQQRTWCMEVLAHQREALEEIVRRARAYFRGDWRGLPVEPRWASLLVGPTGTGKTAVATMAADRLSAEISGEASITTLIVATPSWIPIGANNRGAKETLGVIATHIARNARTILVLDELDKITSGPGGAAGFSNGSDTWQVYIRGELYSAVLDARWPTGLTLPDTDDDAPVTIDELTRKLRENVFILGIGTFQSWFDSADTRRSMGFGAEIETTKEILTADIIADQMLHRELANRLNSGIIRIPELRTEDYHHIADEVANKLPLHMQDAFRAEVAKQIPGAISAKKGVRYLEEVMMATLIQLPPEPAQPIPDILAITSDIANLDLCTL